MLLVEFPKVDVRFQRKTAAMLDYPMLLGIPINHQTVAGMSALPYLIETFGRFLGATAEGHAKNYQSAKRAQRPTLQDMEKTIAELAKKGLVYGASVRLDGAELNEYLGLERLLSGEGLTGNDMDRILIMPSEKYTEKVWGFVYKPEHLSTVRIIFRN